MDKQYPDEIYIFVKQGKVQVAGDAMVGAKIGKIWPVARTYEDAKRLIDYWKVDGVHPAMVGSMPGESLHKQVRLAIEDGCFAAACIIDWNVDGAPVWGVLNFDKYKSE